MRKALLFISFVVVIAGLGLALRRHLPLERMVENEQHLRTLIQQHPLRAWVAGFAIYVAVALIPGTTGKAMIAGWLFGFWPGVVMVDLALMLAALLTLLVSRSVFQDIVHARFGFAIERIDRGLERGGAFYLLMLRLIHLPYTLVNYVCGATRVRVQTFCWTTAFGLLPGTIIFVLAGTRLPTLAELLERGTLELLDPWLLGCLAATAVLPVAVRVVLRQVQRHPAPDDDELSAT